MPCAMLGMLLSINSNELQWGRSYYDHMSVETSIHTYMSALKKNNYCSRLLSTRKSNKVKNWKTKKLRERIENSK